MVTTSLQGRRATGAESLRRSRSRFGILGDVKAYFEASYILSYNVVQDHERDISIKGNRGLRPPGDLIYSDLSVLKP